MSVLDILSITISCAAIALSILSLLSPRQNGSPSEAVSR